MRIRESGSVRVSPVRRASKRRMLIPPQYHIRGEANLVYVLKAKSRWNLEKKDVPGHATVRETKYVVADTQRENEGGYYCASALIEMHASG